MGTSNTILRAFKPLSTSTSVSTAVLATNTTVNLPSPRIGTIAGSTGLDIIYTLG